MWPDYDREPVEIDEDTVWQVFDPWTGQLVGMFYDKINAQLFSKAYMKREKKKAAKHSEKDNGK